MAEKITMPRLSDTMEEGTVVKWHKKIGDSVKEGDILAEIETDKAIQEFESELEGILLYIGVEEGKSAPVDAILAIIGNENEDISEMIEAGESKPEEPQQEVQPEEGKDTTENESSSQQEEAAESSPQSSERILASPLAKKVAEEKGIDLTDVKGSGDHGRIIRKDVENYTPPEKTEEETPAVASEAPAETSKISAPAVPASTPRPAVPTKTLVSAKDESTAVPNSSMRKVIAKRLVESKFTAPHFYLNVDVNMDNAIKARKGINALPDTKISFNDIVIKACAMALRKHPRVNSSWTEDNTILYQHIHIGVAVAVEDGLLVPVVKNADFKPFSEISAEVKDLASRARERKLKADEMEGSTFSVSNLGMYGIESFTSIINQPNSCILSVGAIIEKPIVKKGKIVVGNVMKLSLACDHRTVDGATGALFLQTLVQYIENPLSMFV